MMNESLATQKNKLIVLAERFRKLEKTANHEIFQAFSEDSTCHVFANHATKEIDITIVDEHDGESNTISLSSDDARVLYENLVNFFENNRRGGRQ